MQNILDRKTEYSHIGSVQNSPLAPFVRCRLFSNFDVFQKLAYFHCSKENAIQVLTLTKKKVLFYKIGERENMAADYGRYAAHRGQNRGILGKNRVIKCSLIVCV